MTILKIGNRPVLGQELDSCGLFFAPVGGLLYNNLLNCPLSTTWTRTQLGREREVACNCSQGPQLLVKELNSRPDRGVLSRLTTMSKARMKREREEDAVRDEALRGAKKALFGEWETDVPAVCAIDFGTARTGYAFAFTRRPGDDHLYASQFSCACPIFHQFASLVSSPARLPLRSRCHV